MYFQRRATPLASLLFLLIAVVLPVDHAAAQSGDIESVRREMAQLKREIADLRRQIAAGRGGSPKSIGGELPPTLAARMEVRLQQLESEVRSMTGKFEELGHRMKQLGEKLDKTVSDMELRIAALERGKPITAGGAARTQPRTAGTPKPRRTAGGGGAARPKTPPARSANPRAAPKTTGGGTQTAKLPEGKPAEQYQYAMSLLRRQEYDKAAAALRAFIQQHPKGDLTGNAVYWLGEAYYVRGDYTQAAVHFAEGFKKYPKSPKAPDNLLKLGMSFGKLKKRAEACASFYELRRRYPRAPTYIRRAAAGQARRMRCG